MQPLDLGAKRLGRCRDHRVVEQVRSRLGNAVIGQDNQPWPPPGYYLLQQPKYPQPSQTPWPETHVYWECHETSWFNLGSTTYCATAIPGIVPYFRRFMSD